MARTSRTPGKTQHLNVFRLPLLYLLDLPGYGYARASASERRRFRSLVEGVIGKRRRLAGVVWLLDIRHPPSGDDLAMGALLSASGRPVVIALTKADKLPRSRQLAARRQRAAELGLPADADIEVTSSEKRSGIAQLAVRIVELIGAPDASARGG
jgi:GTP-binding protein